MKLKNLIEQLQSIVATSPASANYTVKFRGENQEEHITHHHVEGRTLYLSDVWASDRLNPLSADPKETARFSKVLVAFLTDKQMLALEKAAKSKES